MVWLGFWLLCGWYCEFRNGFWCAVSLVWVFGSGFRTGSCGVGFVLVISDFGFGGFVGWLGFVCRLLWNLIVVILLCGLLALPIWRWEFCELTILWLWCFRCVLRLCLIGC